MSQTSTSTLTVHTEGVRIFLHSAHETAAAAECLLQMRDRRKDKESAEAHALWNGYFCLSQKLDEDLAALCRRGGLLHFGCARVDRTERGEFVLAGVL